MLSATNIAIAMGLAINKQQVSARPKACTITLWNSLLDSISGENFFAGLDIGRAFLFLDRNRMDQRGRQLNQRLLK
jgi:hypothetical protein